jgi:hypothetical protein
MTQISVAAHPDLGLGSPMTDWSDPGAAAEVAAWVSAAVGEEVTSVEQGKLRPWAVLWQVRTVSGSFWAKQNCPGQLFEAELVSVLAGLAPAYVVPVEAVDVERGLLLTRDQGPVFAETVADDDLDAWCRLASRSMELARLVADDGAALLATGLTAPRVPDDVVDLVTPWQQELEALGLPTSLVHNDLNTHNAFDLSEGLVFFDFADAVWDHPLTTLLVPLNELASRLDDPGPDDPRLRRVADAALEVWSDRASPADLRRALPAALRLGRLGRAESWARIEPHLGPEARVELGGAAAAWLARLPDEAPVRFADVTDVEVRDAAQ